MREIALFEEVGQTCVQQSFASTSIRVKMTLDFAEVVLFIRDQEEWKNDVLRSWIRGVSIAIFDGRHNCHQ